MSKPVSRDLLQLESAGPAASPFLISPSGVGGGSFPLPPPPTAGGKLKTFAVPPPSALLARVAAFLPQMAQANQTLEKEIARGGASQFNIENVEDESKPHIEMNLDVGVLEAQKADESLEESSIVIPGVSSPSSLAAEAAASSYATSFAASIAAAVASHQAGDESDESDDEDASPSSSRDSTAAPGGSSLSRAARKKKKYRVRAREKQSGGGGGGLVTDGAMQDTNDDDAPLPKRANPLIQEMED